MPQSSARLQNCPKILLLFSSISQQRYNNSSYYDKLDCFP